MFGKVKIWLAAAVAVGVAFIAAYLRGRSDEKVDSKLRGYEDTLDKMRTAREVDREIEVLDDTGLADRASKWLRDAGK